MLLKWLELCRICLSPVRKMQILEKALCCRDDDYSRPLVLCSSKQTSEIESAWL